MPDKPTPAASGGDAIHASMTEQEIRDAGLAVDVPFESGEPKPERLRYADLGMAWTPPADWPPEEGQPQSDGDASDA